MHFMKVFWPCLTLLFGSVAFGTSYAPSPPPEVSCSEALKIAEEFASKDNSEIGKYYIDRMWCGSIPNEGKRCWVISWANPDKGWYFVTVYMDRSVKRPPDGPLYSMSVYLESARKREK